MPPGRTTAARDPSRVNALRPLAKILLGGVARTLVAWYCIYMQTTKNTETAAPETAAATCGSRYCSETVTDGGAFCSAECHITEMDERYAL